MIMAPEQEKRAWFEDFWKERDPTPDTPENELMEEYYTRVAYANQKFYAGRAGWRTDRGAVYIIYGPPDSVQRRTLWDSIGREQYYEIWRYEGTSRKFVFLYDSLLGDFRLTSSQ
jgi:GWxTD domain-containing protein